MSQDNTMNLPKLSFVSHREGNPELRNGQTPKLLVSTFLVAEGSVHRLKFFAVLTNYSSP